ncbi:sigma-70 family RNA polymerase sigma factor [Actinocorallia sp. A-T 12471]|uniref:RNA polymerase sigma factor n=1 Tax=Actinocorallia sp. A-T 12471 TaxID=3089813 RepID=UPI0029D205B0|nr:sigma-70 family RNA polymerase sigma factor [Actinocorallia sp. A-T 12471]MDX6741960.1 sigma-70 family RNA polymerase sigma factor [Actinocorallia sp. A-T 12471]
MGEQQAVGPSDAELIERTRQGDTAVYGVLYERHKDAARRLARSLVDGDAEADDAVADAFTRVLAVIQRGGGPSDAFRPYLLTSLRRTVVDRYRRRFRETSTDAIESYDPGVPFVDPALAGLENELIVRAYLSLPERWQAVLWHTVVEGEKPAQAGKVLGLSANGTSVLAMRAKEGLRTAYLRMHVPERLDPARLDAECVPVLDMLPRLVRDSGRSRGRDKMDRHLSSCPVCKEIYEELHHVNQALGTHLPPLVLGLGAASYLAKGGLAGLGLLWGRTPKKARNAAGAGVAVALVAAAVMALPTSNTSPPEAPGAAAPPGVAPEAPGGEAAEPGGGESGVPARPSPARPSPAKPSSAQLPAQPVRPEPVSSGPQNGQGSGPAVPSASPSPPLLPKLLAEIGTVGALLPGSRGIVALAVRNAGRGASDDIIADVSLPEGVVLDGAGAGRAAAGWAARVPLGDGWACRPADAALRCTRAGLPAGGSSSAYLHVNVAAGARQGAAPSVAVRSSGTRVTARGKAGVRAAGLPARYAVDGRVRVLRAGNALLSCRENERGCAEARQRKGGRLDNDLWKMTSLDLDAEPSTTRSSSARLTLPGRVLFAGLYWSGVGRDGATAKLRAPSGGYKSVQAEQTDVVDLPGYPAYQSFADVTAQVKAGGTGEWTVADVRGDEGVGRYAGWSLVVVSEDVSAPLSRAMVLDGARALGPTGADTLQVPLDGLLPAAIPADLGFVVWEGDEELADDKITLDGRALGGDNAFRSVAEGAVGQSLTFGVDVIGHEAELGGRSAVSLTTKADAYVAGVVTVTAPLRS